MYTKLERGGIVLRYSVPSIKQALAPPYTNVYDALA
jgi:hypothetical protein